MRHFKTCIGILAVVATSVSCGNVVRQGKSPVFLVVDLLQARHGGVTQGQPSGFLHSDVLTLITTPSPCTTSAPCPTIFNDTGTATLRTSFKDVTSTTGPTTNNDVTITRYHVRFIRADGRNVPGVDVPYPFDGAATGTIPSGSTLTLAFELVRHVAKEESPLVQLVYSPTIISTIAEITFYGQDAVGNEVSATGSISVDFGNFGDF